MESKQPGGKPSRTYVGARRDLLRRIDGALRIARRKLTLDQNVLSAKNVSIFF
jgi:ethylbenzene dioxygenase beta subunit